MLEPKHDLTPLTCLLSFASDGPENVSPEYTDNCTTHFRVRRTSIFASIMVNCINQSINQYAFNLIMSIVHGYKNIETSKVSSFILAVNLFVEKNMDV